MNNAFTISTLYKAVEDLERQEAEAIELTKKPFRARINELLSSIEHLKSKELKGNDGELRTKPYTGKKRGRKTKLTNSLVYPKQGTVLQKLIYVLKEINHFATIKEIAIVVKHYEPTLSEVSIKEKFGKHIYKYTDKGFIVQYKVGSRRNTVYGLATWYKDGKPVEGKEHDENVLIDKVIDDSDVITLDDFVYPPIDLSFLMDSKLQKGDLPF